MSCPLEGRAYIYLAKLDFLNDRGGPSMQNYVEQALRSCGPSTARCCTPLPARRTWPAIPPSGWSTQSGHFIPAAHISGN